MEARRVEKGHFEAAGLPERRHHGVPVRCRSAAAGPVHNGDRPAGGRRKVLVSVRAQPLGVGVARRFPGGQKLGVEGCAHLGVQPEAGQDGCGQDGVTAGGRRSGQVVNVGLGDRSQLRLNGPRTEPGPVQLRLNLQSLRCGTYPKQLLCLGGRQGTGPREHP
jgi:hypothetical protein